jgi:hypothetical protein
MAGGTILFIRGATRSGGFLEGGSVASRDEQLAEINNASTAEGNHGWGTLAQALRDAGFQLEQRIEPKGAEIGNGFTSGSPIRFENLDLSRYSAIVFGSNNAKYPKASVDAIARYIHNGGGAIFLADANFGSSWRDSADSDQQFLSRFGLTVQQDNGVVTAAGTFPVPNHPILAGVGAFEGEGVSPITIPTAAPTAITITRIAGTTGQVRNNDGADPSNNFAGSLRPANDRDASLAVVNFGRGRVAAYFDRNTFFNANGKGTDINRLNNRQLALNLFNWVADATPPAVSNVSFQPGAPTTIRLTFDDNLFGSLARKDILLRDRITGAAIPRTRWAMVVTESTDQTELLIRIKGAQPPGRYQLQINPGKISDDSGNVNAARIRFNFTLA